MPSTEFHPPDPAGARRTFEQIIALPDDRFDVAEAVLALAAESQPADYAKKIADSLQDLDAKAAKAKADLPANPDGEDYFDSLYEIVLDRKAAQAFREDRAEDYDLSYAVMRHQGSCLSVGIMNLAVARRMNAPIWGAQCPGHFFLRYVPPPGSKAHAAPLNFDVTRPAPGNWKSLDDSFYRKWRKFDSHAEEMGAYLRPLSDREVISAFLASRSGYFSLQKKYEEGLRDAQRALQLNPRNITACINAGYDLEALNKLEEGEQQYRQALQLDSRSVQALNNLAYLKVRDSKSKVYDPKEADSLIDTALKHEPDRAYLHATKGEVKAAREDWRSATREMLDAMRLDPKNPRYHERFLAFRKHLRHEE